MFTLRTLSLTFAVLCIAGVAHAGEGVLEINRTCAFNTGCFPGDTAGLPVTIRNPGSYALTSNIDFYGEDLDAIFILADDVSIDMRGFRIECRVSAIVIGGGTPPLCSTVSGTSRGVSVDGLNTRYSAEVKNGTIIGMASHAVRLGTNSIVRNMRLRRNRVGTLTYHGGLIENTAFYGNDTGMNLTFGGGYRGNAIYYSSADYVIGGVNLGGNMCGASLCP